MKKYKVGVIGATGMVGQRFVSLLEKHPWFELSVVAASSRSAGKTYGECAEGRWMMETTAPQTARELVVKNAKKDIQEIADSADFVFSAVDLEDDATAALEEAYARAECPVVSNNKAHRWTPDVPMVIPELNPEHLSVLEHQRKRLGTARGFIAVKSNCSIQSYVPALHPLKDEFGLSRVLTCTYQAISGASKTFASMPEMFDNVIPYIGGGEEEKSEREPLKIWGTVKKGVIVPAEKPLITAQCVRVPVSDGHLAAVFASFAEKPPKDEILKRWDAFEGVPQKRKLPSAPERFLKYFEEKDRPQTGLDRMLGNGMSISIGRLREDTQYDYKFICLSHNTLRGAAGGAVLLAELLCAEGHLISVK
ncbi:MAG: aspartate-semialdehyde dehydrogenase [Oscillospiraceae bacterium]|jgi:aspartate-semialdehyde dehydrogenase|nr:aspartate-semialdehyde dehydrogenase [Oscillospiraceae bacterium]